MRVALLSALALLSVACFDPADAEGTGAATGSSSGTTGGEPQCVDGSVACPCYGNGTCDAGLECNATVELCIPEDCAPGSENCTCNDGQCLPAFACTDGVCVTPSAGTTGTTDPSATDPSATDSAEATTDPSATDPSLTDTAEATTDPSDPSVTDTAEATTDPTGVPGCEADCATCWSCATSDPALCADAWNACAGDAACADLAGFCMLEPDSCPTFCVDADPAAVELFTAAAACANTVCVGCTQYSC